eukprot:jgi/Tetstr1/465237/TSEL_009940.t1
MRPGRLRGMCTQLVGANAPPLHAMSGRFRGPRTQQVGASGPPRLHHFPCRFHGPGTQLVDANMPPLHHVSRSLPRPGNADGSPGTQLVDAVSPSLRHVPQPRPWHVHAAGRRQHAVIALRAVIYRFRGMRTQFVGANGPPLHQHTMHAVGRPIVVPPLHPAPGGFHGMGTQ